MRHCPDCNSDAVIPWDDGYLCCSCGCEFDDPNTRNKGDREEEEDE